MLIRDGLNASELSLVIVVLPGSRVCKVVSVAVGIVGVRPFKGTSYRI